MGRKVHYLRMFTKEVLTLPLFDAFVDSSYKTVVLLLVILDVDERIRVDVITFLSMFTQDVFTPPELSVRAFLIRYIT